MHPAYSLVLFTVSSGAGYGLLAVLGLTLLLGAAPPAPWLLLTALGLGLGLASFGLLASTRHLKRPERAWRAFSQWRTSWLSREGVAALAVYAAAFPLAGLLLLLPPGNGFVRLLAAATAALALATILCTAMIYASLKPIPRWHHPAVPVVYLCLGLATGALLLDALFLLAGRDVAAPRALALLALVGAFAAKELSWRAAGRRGPALTTAAATGLARFGEVRLLEAPHTEGNYLLREMGYRVARHHAAKLRRIVRLAAFAVPAALVAVLLLVEPPPFLRGALAALAAASAVVGALVERWLFFAEARHTVSLYYGASAV
jgi:sulfite dehydrogenase (quinone) subunit SoeC